MSIHEYLLKARQDDAVRAGERDRRLLEARRARMAGGIAQSLPLLPLPSPGSLRWDGWPG